MTTPWHALLQRRRPAILDGALATELERRGCDLNDPLWSARILLDDPGVIRDVHLDYLRAGADIITTSSYQGSFTGFGGRGIDQQGAETLFRRSVDLARQARDRFLVERSDSDPIPLIASSVGPYGATLHDGSEYHGNYRLSRRELREFHAPRLACLAALPCEVLACETIPSLEEAMVLAELLAEVDKPAWISLTCRDGRLTAHGENIELVARDLEGRRGVAAIGINCTSPTYLGELIGRLKTATHKPIIVYPNSGENFNVITKRWRGSATLEDFIQLAAGWKAAGAAVIGGCCRVGPEAIARLCRVLHAGSAR